MTDRCIDSQRLQRGFTLAEILVTTAIFAIIMIAALAVYDKSNQVFKQSTEAADMQQSTRIGFDKLVADLRMAGFDYNRGGIPNGDGQYSQPDEQIEYAGVRAVAFRANFDYNADAEHGNGLEDNAAGGENYTPRKDGHPVFPYVTTGNDEIVIYALRSADNTKNTDSISFWADTDMPRSGWPGSSSNGKERLVTVGPSVCSTCGIDLTDKNPPYTLYRMTVADVLNKLPGTPVAENIRSMAFHYFTDRQGTTALADPDIGAGPVKIDKGRNGDGSTFDATLTVNGNTVYTGAIGGAGQYDATNASTQNVNDRSQRTLISSIRVDLTGMNSQPDGKYVHPTETITSIKNYRQYDLHALVVPRNLGLTGFPEPTTNTPGQPTITGMCTGACATPFMCWTPPPTGGTILKYTVQWALTATGPWDTYSFDVVDSTATSLQIPDDVGPAIDPSKTWYYQIFAVNDNGAGPPSNPFNAVPKNVTKPLPPTDLQASTTLQPRSANPSSIDNTITVRWSPSTDNDPATANLTCNGACTTSGSKIPSTEKILYQVYRGTDRYFTIDKGVQVLSFGGTQPAAAAPMTFIDSPTTSAFPPGTCVQYYYRIQAADRCIASDTYNVSGSKNTSLSKTYPDDTANEPGIAGIAYDAGVLAQAPVTLQVDTAKSSCPSLPNQKCDIFLQWPKVTADTSNNALGVDRYKIIRSRKKKDDATYNLDTTMDPSTGKSYISVSGYSQSNAGTATYEDKSGAGVDSNDGQPWYYQYTVQADDCSGGKVSPEALYPTSCSVNPSIVETDAQSGNSSSAGQSPQAPWIMNSGDYITVTPPGSVTVSTVSFDINAYPSGVAVSGSPVTIPKPGPYKLTWTDRTDGQIYQIKVTVTLDTGCKEIYVRYVQDLQPSACAVANVTAVTPSATKSGAIWTAKADYTIKNNGTDPLVISGKAISLTWARPDANHDDMTFTSLAFVSGAVSTTDSFSDFTPGTKALFFPSHGSGLAATGENYAQNLTGLPAVAAGANLTITPRWQYKKKDDPLPATPNVLQKLCIAYSIAAEPGVTKFCNIVGQAASTSNPNACD